MTIPKGAIKYRQSKQDRQYNGKKTKDINYLQNITHKTKCRATKSHKALGINLGSPEGYAVPTPLV